MIVELTVPVVTAGASTGTSTSGISVVDVGSVVTVGGTFISGLLVGQSREMWPAWEHL